MTDASGLAAQARTALDRAERCGHVETAELLAGINAMIGALEPGERVALGPTRATHAAAMPLINDSLGLSR